MNYKTLVQQFTFDGYMKKLAGSIKNKMNELRQQANPNDSRRWIWELIQNGKDARQPNIPFSVKIELLKLSSPAELAFYHNGAPFSVKNITYLVEQVSSKDQEPKSNESPANTGKFGSGFITTHLLSEVVEIETIVKSEGLEFKKCKILLDRSKRSEDDIAGSIKESLSVLEELDTFEDVPDYDPSDFNTVFRYKLDSNGLDIAETGLKDLEMAIPYTLVFVQAITNVNISSTDTSYRIVHEYTEQFDNIQVFTVEREDLFGNERLEIAFMRGEKASIAVRIERQDGHIHFVSLPSTLPRLFCDFPIIGTEDFPFPVVVNSSFFNLNDPRSIVRLTDIDDPDINENKEIIREATALYCQLITFCENEKVHEVYNIANCSPSVEKEWISREWYKENVQNPIFQHLSNSAIIETENGGRLSVTGANGEPNIYFPNSNSKGILLRIFDLAADWFPHALPKRSDMYGWHSVIWPQCQKLGLKKLTQFIQATESIGMLQTRLVEGTDVVEWLNRYYDLLNQEGHFIKDIIANEVMVLPSQNGNLKLMKELHWDEGIPSAFKDCLLTLGYDIREELRYVGLVTKSNYTEDPKHQIGHSPKKLDAVFSKTNEMLRKANDDQAFEAALYLARITTFNLEVQEVRSNVLQTIVDLYSQRDLSAISVSCGYQPVIFEEANKALAVGIAKEISHTANLMTFKDKFGFPTEAVATKWLGSFIEALELIGQSQILNDERYPILLNENGTFCIKEALVAGPDTNSILKDISARIGHDFRGSIVDPGMPISFATKPLTNQDIADKIMSIAGTLMTDMHSDDDIRAAFQRLFEWLNQNSSLASELFGDLYVNRHRLCAAETIVVSIEKAASYDEIAKEFAISDFADLRKRLEEGNHAPQHQQLTPVTQDILISLGVKNFEELKTALEDRNLAEIFGHESIPTYEQFLFVEALIERRKNRIKHFLTELGYDFSLADSTATTVFSGVVKDGKDIDIVCRPSDGGHVIFYYGAEKQILQNSGAELWIDDGQEYPFQLTLGRILIDNNISKIKII